MDLMVRGGGLYQKMSNTHMCAGGSELSDAMSEGERPEEISSLCPEGQDSGMQPVSSPLHPSLALPI